MGGREEGGGGGVGGGGGEGGGLAQCDIQSGDESQHKKLKAAAQDQPANKYSN